MLQGRTIMRHQRIRKENSSVPTLRMLQIWNDALWAQRKQGSLIHGFALALRDRNLSHCDHYPFSELQSITKMPQGSNIRMYQRQAHEERLQHHIQPLSPDLLVHTLRHLQQIHRNSESTLLKAKWHVLGSSSMQKACLIALFFQRTSDPAKEARREGFGSSFAPDLVESAGTAC